METMKSIRTEAAYRQALVRLEVIFDAAKGTPEGDELETLSMLLDQYEQAYFPIEIH